MSSFAAFMTGALVIFCVGVAVAIISANKHNEAIQAMSPDERNSYLYGQINEHLICPHCQTKGMVRAKKVSRTAVSTGKVGGILKTDTTSQITTLVTQHHCGQCATTWDV